MALDADEIVDRRRLRRKLTAWRVGTFLVLAAAVIAVGLFALRGGDRGPGYPHIARLTISGFIEDNRRQQELIDRLRESPAVRGVIIAINSGGGASAGGEALYEAIRKLATEKPTVASMGTVAASAAYLAAIATDHVVARRTTITGSIGVIFEYPEVSDLLEKLGVNIEEVRSRPLKAEPSPYHPTTPEARAVIAALVEDGYQWFVSVVAERRALERDRALELADGRIYSGNQALAVGLIDELGGEDVAKAWLVGEGLSVDLPVRDWAVRTGGVPFLDVVLGWFARQIGLPDSLGLGVGDILSPRLRNLDGLVSVWHAPALGDPAGGAAR